MNELTTTESTDIGSYLSALTGGGNDELAELRAEANPFAVMPRLVLSKKTKEITAIQGDETVYNFNSRNPLYFVAILIAERRALWEPGNPEAGSMPVCSTPHCKIGTFRRDNDNGVGIWNLKDNPDIAPPFKVYEDEDHATYKHYCADCPWNKFGSMRDWDTSREEGRGKACNEGRLLVGYVCSPVPNIELPGNLRVFNFDDKMPMVYMNVPASSIKVIKSIGNACVGRNIAARYCVFNLGCNPQKNGVIEWGELTAELHGFINQHLISVSDDQSKAIREMVFTKNLAEVVDRMERDPDAKEDGDKAPAFDEEVPF